MGKLSSFNHTFKETPRLKLPLQATALYVIINVARYSMILGSFGSPVLIALGHRCSTEAFDSTMASARQYRTQRRVCGIAGAHRVSTRWRVLYALAQPVLRQCREFRSNGPVLKSFELSRFISA